MVGWAGSLADVVAPVPAALALDGLGRLRPSPPSRRLRPVRIADVMKTNLRSSPRLASADHSSPCVAIGTVSATLACSDEPTLPASRSVSISLLTSSRAARMRVHLSSSASSGAPISRVGLEEDRFGVAEQLPRFLGREAEERRHPAQHRVRDVPQRRLRAAARQRLRRRGVEPVLEDVEVERAQVFRAIDLQLGHHRVELVDLVVRQHLGLELRGARQRVAVDLQQSGRAAPRPWRDRSR